MTTHGHRFISDILYGATADKVRHEVEVPVLLLKVQREVKCIEALRCDERRVPLDSALDTSAATTT